MKIDPKQSDMLCANGGPIKCKVTCDLCREIERNREPIEGVWKSKDFKDDKKSKCYVRWRHIPPDAMMTPRMYISIDHSVVECEDSDYAARVAIYESLKNVVASPDHISIESRQHYPKSQE